MKDTIISVEDIYSTWPGRDNQEKIRNFIKNAVTSNGTQYVLLGGDAEIVPYRKTWCRKAIGDWNDTLPCDLYYSDLDGNWDVNGNGVFGEMSDSVDMYPDVWVGRAPVSISEEVMRFSDKFTTYCQSNGADYLKKVLLVGMDLDNLTPTAEAMEYYCANYIPPQYNITKVYDSQSSNHKTSMLNALNSGVNICFHSDHGTVDSTGCGNKNHSWNIYSNEFYGLTNFSQYSVFTSTACLHGAFDFSDCAMENFFNAPLGGAVLCMTNSRFGWYAKGQNPQRSFSAAYMEFFVQRIFQHSPASAIDFLVGKQDLAGVAQVNDTYRWSMYTLNLFGDPAMPIWTPYHIGIEDSTQKNTVANIKVIVYSNPIKMNSRIRAILPNKEVLTFTLYNVSGRKVAEKDFYPSNELVCNLKDIVGKKKLSSGTYFLFAHTNSGEQTVNKIVILK